MTRFKKRIKRARRIETVTLTQPAYCRGNSNCGRDRRGLWHCNCLNQSKQEPRKQQQQ
nr:MAG TPA: hypothetical protein [Caudoviricetes sp.]